jgi:hypothetical protein
MMLSAEDAKLFFKLHHALVPFLAEKLGLKDVPRPGKAISVETRRELVKSFVGRPDLIDAFVAANPAGLSAEELEIVSSWRHAVAGRFIALRQLKNHMIFLSDDNPPTAYGVVALLDALELVITQPLPALIETLLLPFRDKIIYDGMILRSNISFGPGLRRSFEDNFRTAKASAGIVESLPAQATGQISRDSNKPKKKVKPASTVAVPEVGQIAGNIIAMTDAFCRDRLNEEYAALCRKAAETLSRKRPSPLLKGQPEVWACGIIRTIGRANFLDDRAQSPHLKLPEIDRTFGVAESTGQGKSKIIRDLLKIHRFDHRWTLPSKWENTSMIWLLNVDGYMIDIRQAAVDLQRAAFEKGLIPYVPADRAEARGAALNAGVRRLLQFKITLLETQPPIWRRIQVFDDTLDKLHEHIQSAMGWTNSHLHEFMINGQRCGDPQLLDDGFEPFEAIDSTKTLVSTLLPSDGKPCAFEYTYDFGDGWLHEVIFERSPAPEPGVKYPRCLEGERACPPEDVGGVLGFEQYLKAMGDPKHPEHEEMLAWRGKFNESDFGPRQATQRMQEGLPDWRKMTR